MKTGIQLITIERAEQIYKHGFNVEQDSEYYKNGELVQAAHFCLALADIEKRFDVNRNAEWPWLKTQVQRYDNNIRAKDRIGQLKIAGALLMAENDRLSFEAKHQQRTHDEMISAIALLIDDILSPVNL